MPKVINKKNIYDFANNYNNIISNKPAVNKTIELLIANNNYVRPGIKTPKSSKKLDRERVSKEYLKKLIQEYNDSIKAANPTAGQLVSEGLKAPLRYMSNPFRLAGDVASLINPQQQVLPTTGELNYMDRTGQSKPLEEIPISMMNASSLVYNPVGTMTGHAIGVVDDNTKRFINARYGWNIGANPAENLNNIVSRKILPNSMINETAGGVVDINQAYKSMINKNYIDAGINTVLGLSGLVEVPDYLKSIPIFNSINTVDNAIEKIKAVGDVYDALGGQDGISQIAGGVKFANGGNLNNPQNNVDKNMNKTNKKSFASRAKDIINRYKRADFDPQEKAELEAALAKLAQEQETYKQVNGIGEYSPENIQAKQMQQMQQQGQQQMMPQFDGVSGSSKLGANTLWEYYDGKIPSVADRAKMAKEFGIDGYNPRIPDFNIKLLAALKARDTESVVPQPQVAVTPQQAITPSQSAASQSIYQPSITPYNPRKDIVDSNSNIDGEYTGGAHFNGTQEDYDRIKALPSNEQLNYIGALNGGNRRRFWRWDNYGAYPDGPSGESFDPNAFIGNPETEIITDEGFPVQKPGVGLPSFSYSGIGINPTKIPTGATQQSMLARSKDPILGMNNGIGVQVERPAVMGLKSTDLQMAGVNSAATSMKPTKVSPLQPYTTIGQTQGILPSVLTGLASSVGNMVLGATTKPMQFNKGYGAEQISLAKEREMMARNANTARNIAARNYRNVGGRGAYMAGIGTSGAGINQQLTDNLSQSYSREGLANMEQRNRAAEMNRGVDMMNFQSRMQADQDKKAYTSQAINSLVSAGSDINRILGQNALIESIGTQNFMTAPSANKKWKDLMFGKTIKGTLRK